jgi:hypothetical protein
MSIITIHDTDNGNRCFVYSEKNFYTVNVTKSQHSVFIHAHSPVTVHMYMYVIATDRSHIHNVIGAILFIPTTHSHDITWCLLPQFVVQNFIKGDQQYSCSFLHNYWKDDLKTDPTNIWLHFTVIVFKRLALFLPQAVVIH